MQLLRAVDDNRFYSGQRQDLKKLAITVWVALLVALGSGKLGITGVQALVVLCAPTIVFWVTDAMMYPSIRHIYLNILLLESMLSNQNYEIDDSKSIFVATSYRRISHSEKISLTLKSLLSSEISLVFYTMQLIVSVFFVLYFLGV